MLTRAYVFLLVLARPGDQGDRGDRGDLGHLGHLGDPGPGAGTGGQDRSRGPGGKFFFFLKR